MLGRLFARISAAAAMLIGVAVVAFVLLRVAPGDPIAMMIPPGASEADIAALRVRYGLDKPLIDQFLIWASDALQGDFGVSISLRQDVLGLIIDRVPATLELAFLALVLAVLIGGSLALLSARWRSNWGGEAIDLGNGVLLATPDFIWALFFIILFGVVWPIAPVSGRMDPVFDFDATTNFLMFESLFRLRFDILGDLLHHMVMPAAALALPLAAVIVRLLKASLLEELRRDYVTLARVKGFSEARILRREALRNAVIPTLALIGVQFTFLLGGTVIVERIFAYPGLGNMAIDAVINRDLPLIQGLLLTFGVLFMLINLAVECLATLANPRLRHGG